MKCQLTEKKKLKVMLGVGLALVVLGAAAAYLLPDEAHLATRIAGFVSGLGAALAVMGGVLLLRHRRLGEAGARDAALQMNDERGVAVAYKAQSVMAFAAVIALAILTIAAMLRGDTFYMIMGAVMLFAVGIGKLIALYIFNRLM